MISPFQTQRPLCFPQRPLCFPENPKCNGGNCTYQIIHAYGWETYGKIDPVTKKVKLEFSRKVMVTGHDITAIPTGFGRIKLWD